MKRVVQGIEYVSGGLLMLLSALIVIQVLLRNFIGWGFPWSEEMARYLLLTMVLLMSPILFYRDEHVKLDFFSGKMSTKTVKIYRTVVILVTLFFYAVYVYSHLNFVERMGDVRTPSLNIPNFWFFMAGLIGAALGLVLGIYKIAKTCISGNKQ